MSLSISSLLADYRSGKRTPTRVIESLLAADDPDYACAWIHRMDAQALRTRATELESQFRADPSVMDRLPLFGIPFAVKDNIDVAGVPTTAACPAFAYLPTRSATVVERLQAAGAILVGKTNLDQFATGLVGTRSPYGPVPNAHKKEYISGGSSSGSAVVVARGKASFSLGTDTAGSGRVPAGLNNLVGMKPTKGLISARGVVPACQSLDCVSIFALTVPDAMAVFDVAQGFDADDPYARTMDAWPVRSTPAFRMAVPEQLEFHGDESARKAFSQARSALEKMGGKSRAVDFTPFLEVAALLYEGPWVAERMAAIRAFYEKQADAMHPVVRTIIGGADKHSASDLFRDLTKLSALRRQAARLWETTDVLVVPTAPTAYTTAEVLADPFVTNRRLGHYTNFVNLLDLAACAVPSVIRADGLPVGITLIGPAGSDRMLADLAQRFHQQTGLKLGALEDALPPAAPIPAPKGSVKVAVVGAHLSGLPLNHELTQRGAQLERATRTAARYRLYALPGTTPPKPGMVRDARGSAIELEVWRMPETQYGSFVAGIPSPLGIGRVELEDGEWVQGFVCEGWALEGAREVTEFGGWRNYLAANKKA
jgi:allophanate hydrolase